MTDTRDILEKILEEIKKLNESLQPETFTWKLKSKTLFQEHIFNKLKNNQQKNAYIKMCTDIANANNLDVQKMENWPTEPLRHLFYSSCKWIGVKDGREKKLLSNLIFEITSNKRGKTYNNQNNFNDTPPRLFTDSNEIETIELFGDDK